MRLGMTLGIMLLCGLPLSAVRAELFPDEPAAALPVALHLPWREVKRSRRQSDQEFPAELHLEDGTVLSLKVRPRGKSRRKECDYFPLWLDFAKKTTAGTVFAGQNKLKLVTHCADKFAGRGYLAREYLAYQLLNRFTDTSFRVRPLRITYVDTTRKNWQQVRDGFLIEHKKGLAKRVEGTVLDVAEVSTRDMAADYAGLVGLFQYLIGNTDFSLRKGPAGDDCCHNAVPIAIDGIIYPVPYDFDVSGFVNPPYAVPQDAMGIRRVTQRKYRGYCRHNDALVAARARFLADKEAILASIENFDDLPDLQPEQPIKFVQKFFEVLEDERQFERKLVERCRG